MACCRSAQLSRPWAWPVPHIQVEYNHVSQRTVTGMWAVRTTQLVGLSLNHGFGHQHNNKPGSWNLRSSLSYKHNLLLWILKICTFLMQFRVWHVCKQSKECVTSNHHFFLQYARIVREALCELELPYILHNVGEGSPKSDLLIQKSGSKEVRFWSFHRHAETLLYFSTVREHDTKNK